MGCLKIAGKHVGSTDGKDISAPGCFSSAAKRKLLGCDGYNMRRRVVAFDADNPEGVEITDEIDSAFASKIIGALAEKLDAAEISKVLKILADADLISGDEVDAVEQLMRGEEESPAGIASDAALSEVAKGFGFDRIKRDNWGNAGADPGSPAGRGEKSIGGTPSQRRLAADQRAAARISFDEMFPEARRLRR